MSYRYAVALTGGIATGKSSVASVFKLLGFSVIDADAIAHQVLDEKADEVVAVFGEEVKREGRIDRKALGRLVFGDVAQRKKLEALLHPVIRQKIEEESNQLDEKQVPYLVDIPLFFETQAYPIERVMVVYVPRELQIKRLMKREGTSQEEAIKRVDSQMGIEEKKKKATFVLDNSGDIKHLQQECERIARILKGE